nr:MAG TPA: antitoxin [Caudoviricetes sp.]
MNKVIMHTGITKTGYCCTCDLLPGWIVTGSKSFDEFKNEVQESIEFYVQCAKEQHDTYPHILDSNFVIIYKFNVQSLLEYYRGIFSFAALQTITGINQKQLAHYASGVSKPRPKQVEKIAKGLHALANELMTITV